MKQLPEKWCIKRTEETWKIITDYFNSLGGTYSYHNPEFPYVPVWNGRNNSQSWPIEEHTEITFEEFEIHVLKIKPLNQTIELW